MSKKPKLPRYVTPMGVAQYPYLTKPDTKFNPDGEYKVNLEIPAEEASEIMSFLDEQLEASVAKAKEENKGKKIKEGDAPYSVNEDTGKVTLKFKLKAKVTTKSGDEWEQKVAVFDAKGTPVTKTPNIGGGSKMKVSYEVIPFYTSLVGAGISLRMRAVQVIELVEFSGGASADSFGFGKEDGYEADNSAEENNEFKDESDSEAEDF
jgi:hypothetical protein